MDRGSITRRALEHAADQRIREFDPRGRTSGNVDPQMALAVAQFHAHPGGQGPHTLHPFFHPPAPSAPPAPTNEEVPRPYETRDLRNCRQNPAAPVTLGPLDSLPVMETSRPPRSPSQRPCRSGQDRSGHMGEQSEAPEDPRLVDPESVVETFHRRMR